MGYKMIAIDMDNTLLDSDKKITEVNKKAITSALDKGIKVVLCSGRFYSEMIDYENILGINGKNQYMITNGGAIIKDLTGKVIYHHVLSDVDCQKITDLLSKNQIKFEMVEINGQTFDSYNQWIGRRKDHDTLEIVKILMRGKKAELDKLEKFIDAIFDENYYIVRPGDEFLEIFPKDINKGQAVLYLGQFLNIDRKDIVAIGDRNNDISMLKIAGLGVAMGNAVDDVKRISDRVTTDNDHSGVGKIIKKLV